ncbi:hypothetical protein FB45DRAFT_913292 [Roridomyces roridus]|uniref:RING-type domain-containing protein n=1 Tax=Roridomyces roridus TaxID=1738132 RepID=A0AAD7BWM9_9AGAR|nr:hypothetical protein FB45DRAFT_913292 [Roridomyces roridus]
MNEVIDISSSSPEPPPCKTTRGQSSTVIVLTDSEDEEPRPRHRDRAGPSKRKPNPPLQRRHAPAGSLENIPSKRGSASKSVPLFLPSDEENFDFEPPSVDLQDESKLQVDPLPGFVSQILEIVPDVDPEYALSLVREQYPKHQDQVVEPVLHLLFEDPSYPKLDRKGKRKRVETDEAGRDPAKAAKIDYGSKDREYKGGIHYGQLSIDQLMLDFPYIPKPHLSRTLREHHSLYAPTFLFLEEEKRKDRLPYVLKTVPSRAPAKGKRKALHDPEFEKEREWITSRAQADPEEDNGECDDGLECGCCFSTYSFDKMIQCPDAHLFCSTCMTTYAETLLGSHDHRIICMDQSGCKLPFPDTELNRFLTPKLMSLYERVKQTKEIAASGLEVEECPFCEFKCVMEASIEQEKLFTCRNEECSAISCRQCKELDHLPKSCKEMQEDKQLDGRHAVEEAMTRALMRNCPKCQKAFIKDAGCNKMSCTNCGTLSCYICRQTITGYEHFGQQPGQPMPAAGSSKNGDKCPLWDVVEQRHADEVKIAAEKAAQDYKRDHPDIDDEHLKVDLPVAPPPPPPPVMVPGYPHPHMNFGFFNRAAPYPGLPPAMGNPWGMNPYALPAVVAPLPAMRFGPPPPLQPAVRAPRQRRAAAKLKRR